MEKNLYIDASHPNETRIVLKSDSSIEEYEYENKNKINFKNNIYLGTVSRVEPSLQAAFINFGNEPTYDAVHWNVSKSVFENILYFILLISRLKCSRKPFWEYLVDKQTLNVP